MKKVILTIIISIGIGKFIFCQEGWYPLPAPTTATITSLFFIDSLNGFIGTGFFGSVYKTTDGGKSWQLKFTEKYDIIHKIQFIDKNYGWFSSGEKGLFRTTDGGESFEFLSFIADTVNGDWYGGTQFLFIDSLRGWGYGARLLYTTDGGITWEFQDTTIKAIIDLFFVDSLNGWLISWYEGKKIFRTRNGGRDWEQLTSLGDSVPVWNMFFCGCSCGLVCG